MSEHSSNNVQKDEQKNDFIRNIIRDDVKAQKYPQIVTRFPPEPNGYLHLGHVKSICLNFGIAEEFGGVCNLRFDDTNPTAEKQDYIDNIENDVKWLGFEWAGEEHHASGYFDQLYAWAVQLIEQGDA
ncbi:MAG: glutamine--tRNA ligase, partial [Psychrobacter sp.]|nr:glutamine--tRNA ligase [Psychrobacter sp.]